MLQSFFLILLQINPAKNVKNDIMKINAMAKRIPETIPQVSHETRIENKVTINAHAANRMYTHFPIYLEINTIMIKTTTNIIKINGSGHIIVNDSQGVFKIDNKVCMIFVF